MLNNVNHADQNNLMTMSNACSVYLVSELKTDLVSFIQVVFKKIYPHTYTATVSTRVSNALLVGDIVGMIVVGLVCDRIDRKTALVGTTLVVIIGTTLATAAHGAHESIPGLFWFLAFARGITGVGVGGEYPASSTSASEAADESMRANRGPGMIDSAKPYAFLTPLQFLSRLPTLSLVLEVPWLFLFSSSCSRLLGRRISQQSGGYALGSGLYFPSLSFTSVCVCPVQNSTRMERSRVSPG